MTDFKLGIGLPTSGSFESFTTTCINNLVQHFERSKYEYGSKDLEILTVDAHLPEARQIVVKEAASAGCSHILWIDSDMVFPADAANRLLNHHKAVVGCNYPRRTFPCIPTAYAKGTFTNDRDGVVYSFGKTGLEEVSHLGMGLMLTDIDVFLHFVDPPWFVFEQHGKHGFKTRGEDVYFCRKFAEQTGLSVWCDHDLSQQVAHIGKFPFTHEFAEAMRKTGAEEWGIPTGEIKSPPPIDVEQKPLNVSSDEIADSPSDASAA